MPRREWDEFDESASNEGSAIVAQNNWRVHKTGKKIQKQRQKMTRGDKIQQRRVEKRIVLNY